jgi:hypothetical protein
MDAEIRGILQLDGECLYVEGDERYPVLWPAGTTWNEDDRAVVTSAGETLRAGDAVHGGGGYLHLDEVARLAGDDAATLAGSCVDNTFHEVAVVNNTEAAITGG